MNRLSNVLNQSYRIINYNSFRNGIRYFSSNNNSLKFSGIALPDHLNVLNTDNKSTSYSDRRNYLLKLSDEELSNKLIDMRTSLESAIKENDLNKQHITDIAEFLSVPLSEVISSPFNLRTSALAMNAGVSFTHHELRKVITPMDDYEMLKRKEQLEKHHSVKASKPSGASSRGMSASTERDLIAKVEQDEQTCQELMKTAPQWILGELEMPKYSSFQQEDQLATYNPAHVSKWTAHEMIHRWCKFFWCEDQNKFQMYLGAKLNELLPVIHWHSLELFDWKSDQTNTYQIANRIKGAVNYFNSELELLEQEIFKGLNSFDKKGVASEEHIHNPTAVLDWSKLNSVTDTMLYVKSHYGRLQSEPLLTVLKSLPGKDSNRHYIDTIGEYKKFIEKRFDQLLFESIQVDQKAALQNRDSRFNIDLLLREANRQFHVYYNYAMSGDKYAANDLSRLEHLCRTLQKRTSKEFQQEARIYLNPAMVANGLKLIQDSKVETVSSNQVKEGLVSCIPATFTMIEYCLERKLLPLPEIKSIDNLLLNFINSSHFYKRELVSKRFKDFIYSFKEMPIIFKYLIEFEELIIDQTKKSMDYWIEELSVSIDEELDSNEMSTFTILPSRSFRILEVNHSLLSQLHKTFSEDIDAKIQELEASINNKKILDREVQKLKSGLDSLVEQSFNPSVYDQPTIFLVGLFDGQFYSLDMLVEWKKIWNYLQSNENGLKYEELKTKSIQLFGEYGKEFNEKEFISTLLELNQYGAIGMFPQIE